MLIQTIKEMRRFIEQVKRGGKTIGFVPTMGYLHEGHMSLVDAAKNECDVVVLSIYVNPVQFGPREDFDKYPRDLERDEDVAGKRGVDAIFCPDNEEMYPEGYSTFVNIEGILAGKLCGASRPGHFKGVATVVAKFFNIVQPDVAFFGQKDAQQSSVVLRITRDLNLPVKIIICPIVREQDGLAMSSRNKHLTGEQRKQALGIYKSLKWAENNIQSGELSVDKLKNGMKDIILEGKEMKMDYLEIVDPETLEPVDSIRGRTLFMSAVYVGEIRLIDNMIINL